MSLVNNSANNFKDFLDAIKPFLNYQFYDMSGQGVEANNFSTDEKVIGTWIDGKPLYQKTVNFGALPNNTAKAISISSLNADKIISYSGMASKTGYYRCLPFSGETIGNNIRVDITDGSLIIYTNDDWSAYSCYVTLRYTKTTDTAVASGEKIVGQWIDGKPVYEKTWDFGSNVAIGTSWSTSLNIDSSNIDKIISGISRNSDGTMYNSEYDPTLSNHTLVGTRMTNSGGVRYVTLRYTKTTD